MVVLDVLMVLLVMTRMVMLVRGMLVTVLLVVTTDSSVIIRQTEIEFLPAAWEMCFMSERRFWKMQLSIIYLYPIKTNKLSSLEIYQLN